MTQSAGGLPKPSGNPPQQGRPSRVLHMHNQRAILAAWEVFLSEGRLLPGPKPVISESWERCRARGVWHRQSEAPLVGEPELFRLKSRNRRLLSAAKPALQRSSLLLSEASSMMLVADTQGFIVEAAGDRRVVEEGRRNHLEEGGRWDEGLIGTNAIGTALALGRPVCITEPSISARTSSAGVAPPRPSIIRATGRCSASSIFLGRSTGFIPRVSPSPPRSRTRSRSPSGTG